LAAGAGILQELAAEGWSKIKKAWGYPQTANAETAQVLAWRASVENARTASVTPQDFPRSLAG
jgi:hypothetical protein